MADELALRPAVAFAEGMQSVEFAEIIRGAVAESGGAESGEMLFLRELFEERRGGAGDVGMMGKAVGAECRPKPGCSFHYAI